MISNSPTINFSNTTDRLRQPQGIVLINGIRAKWVHIEITTTTYYISDSYRVEFPLSGQPPLLTMNYLATIVPMRVQIFIGFPADPNNFSQDDLDLLMVGNVDDLEIDPLTHTFSMSGRDLTSLFIDTKTYEKYSNQTPSEIATLLAQSQGLTPQVTPVPAADKSGIFYTYQHTLLTRETTQWDLLCFLAQQVDYVVFVTGTTLVFEPRPPTSNTPYILQVQPSNFTNSSFTFNGMSLKFRRSLTLAQDVVVNIRVPYSPQNGKAFTVHAASKKARLSNPETQVYTYTISGLTKQQAQNEANQRARDITSHEIRLTAELPGDNTLRKDSLLQVKGTGTDLDHIYYVNSVMRTLNMESGYNMNIEGKNHAVDSQVTL